MADKTIQLVDEYLADIPERQRAALESLREIIKAAAPKAIETITYQIPIFKQNGMLVGFAAAKEHCAFYPCNGAAVKMFAKELKNFDTSKGTIRFQPEKPLPIALVKKIVKTRIAENDAKCAARLAKARKRSGR
jgi:uncharacterized protein YdhG (YjbR/CyaY superfamily)